MATRRASSTDNRLTSISIENFKSISSPQVVQVRGLTLLAGANSSGKSSAMQPLLLMKQTLEATYDPGTFLLDGPNVRFTSAKQVLSIGKKNFSVGFGIGQNLEATLSYVSQKTNGLQIAKLTTSSSSNTAVVIRIGMSYAELREATGKWFDLGPRPAIEFKSSFRVSSERCLLNLGIYVPPPDFGGIQADLGRSQTAIRDFLLDMLHLPGLRGNPERTYKTTSTSNRFPGTFEIYFASH